MGRAFKLGSQLDLDSFLASGRLVAVCLLSPVALSFCERVWREYGGLLHTGYFKRYQGLLSLGLPLFACLHSRETDQVLFALDLSLQLP